MDKGNVFLQSQLSANLLLYDWLLRHVAYGVLVIDSEETIRVATPWAGQFLGFEPGVELKGAKLDIINERMGISREESLLLLALQQGKEYRQQKVRYGEKVFLTDVFPIREPLFNTIIGAAALVQDISAEEGNHNAFLQERNTLQWLMDTSPDAIVAIDKEEVVTFINAKALTYTSLPREEIIGNPYRMFVDNIGADYEQAAAVRALRGEVVNERRETIGKVLHARGFPIRNPDNQEIVGAMAVYTDITERENMYKQLDRLDRLNMVGEVAASIGHEVRNPLTTIKGFLTLLNEKQGNIEDHRETFALMIEELDRANHIITEFLSLAKNRTVEKKLGDLNKLLSNLLPIFEADGLVRNMTVGIYRQPIPLIEINEQEIRQLVTNLVKNAFEAMEPGGKVSISTGMRHDEMYIIVTDEGHGMSRETLEKLGNPFFTTKEDGTGLGLPVCYRIVERHGGRIHVESEEGKGTTFIVYFPVAKKAHPSVTNP